jgi:hypothetical protein
MKRMPWDPPLGSRIRNRTGDRVPEPIYTALGRALSAWEGVNAALNSLFYALHQIDEEDERERVSQAFAGQPKVHDRAQILRIHGNNFLAANFGSNRDAAGKLKRALRMALGKYVGWAARRNELAHGYVTESLSPDYSREDQPIITCYALLPSHAREHRWFHAEPEYNYLAEEIEEFGKRFVYLDNEFEKLANQVVELQPFRNAADT